MLGNHVDVQNARSVSFVTRCRSPISQRSCVPLYGAFCIWGVYFEHRLFVSEVGASRLISAQNTELSATEWSKATLGRRMMTHYPNAQRQTKRWKEALSRAKRVTRLMTPLYATTAQECHEQLHELSRHHESVEYAYKHALSLAPDTSTQIQTLETARRACHALAQHYAYDRSGLTALTKTLAQSGRDWFLRSAALFSRRLQALCRVQSTSWCPGVVLEPWEDALLQDD